MVGGLCSTWQLLSLFFHVVYVFSLRSFSLAFGGGPKPITISHTLPLHTHTHTHITFSVCSLSHRLFLCALSLSQAQVTIRSFFPSFHLSSSLSSFSLSTFFLARSAAHFSHTSHALVAVKLLTEKKRKTTKQGGRRNRRKDKKFLQTAFKGFLGNSFNFHTLSAQSDST